ncbi:hypothetical protein FXF53_03120 [Micromonospora sp. WP24]|uniref:hypothetical protein n=1 Tax=Micromonospora sp. WP24 TaxID=2604469 RepID=UPI0011D3C423|nr:hypothetical protein [Micromonospora sp. WP24]TYC06720.1 hypothetical protein FXF53_03120 [Micromonospora sp. WP24]
MGELFARLRAGYGAGPRHLLVLLLCFAVTGWVALRLAGEATAGRMLLWFVGAVILHDLVLFPLYALLDRGLRAAVGVPVRPSPSGRRSGDAGRAAARLALLNHVRVPALGAALLFLVYLPGVLGWGADTYRAATGQERTPFLGRWLLLSGALFLLSAVVWAIRWARWRTVRRSAEAVERG